MQAAHVCHQLGPRLVGQVVGVAQDDVAVQIQQLLAGQPLHAACNLVLSVSQPPGGQHIVNEPCLLHVDARLVGQVVGVAQDDVAVQVQQLLAGQPLHAACELSPLKYLLMHCHTLIDANAVS